MKTVTTALAGTTVRIITTLAGEPPGSVFVLRNAEGDHTVRAPFLPETGWRVRVIGSWKQTDKFGLQFNATSGAATLEELSVGLAEWLDGAIVGVGPVRAANFVRAWLASGPKLNTSALDALTPADLAPFVDVPRHADLIASALKAAPSALCESWLLGLGMSRDKAKKIVQRFGLDAIQVVARDPYKMALTVDGIGWSSADAIGRALNITANHPKRLTAALVHVMGTRASNGNTVIPRRQCLQEAETLTGVAYEDCERALVQMCEQPERKDHEARASLTLDGESVGLTHFRAMEEKILQFFGRESGEACPSPFPLRAPGAWLTAEQVAAIGLAISMPTVLIDGPAGSGKTTLLRELLGPASPLLEKAIALCAPTGMAAQRMTAATGWPAATIHRLLGYDGENWGFGPGKRLPYAAVIVDEASMIGVPLLWRLVSALADDARLILVGDANQLAPIGPGAPYYDAAQYDLAPIARLRVVQRHCGGLLDACEALLQGRLPTTSSDRTETGRPLWMIQRWLDSRTIAQGVLDSVTDLVENHGATQKTIQVITPRNAGTCGIDSLNTLLQQKFNPGKGAAGLLRPGDPVVATMNRYDLDLMNGDRGEIVLAQSGRYDTKHDRWAHKDLLFASRDGRLFGHAASTSFPASTLAYALTVHKVQGQEFDHVIVALPDDCTKMITRKMIYTAMTRARKTCTLIATAWALRGIMSSMNKSSRTTWMSHYGNAILGQPVS